MKKILFGVAALGLLGLAGAGLGLKAQDTVEAKADDPAYNYIYIHTGSGTDWSNRYIYAFDSTDPNNDSKKYFGAWPGSKVPQVSGIEVTVAANIGNSHDSYWNGGIYRISIPTTSTIDHIIFHNNNGGGDNQTADIPLVFGNTYLYNGGNGYHSLSDAGAAAKVVFDFDKAIGTVGAMCGTGGAFETLTAAERGARFAELYSEYLIASQDNDVAGWLNPSTLTSANQTVETIAAEFYRVATREGYTFAPDGTYSHEANTVLSFEYKDNQNAFVISAVSLTALASGVLLGTIAWKKRHD